MALWDEVKTRVREGTLKRLTNPGNKTASAIDDDQGGRAADAAEADFPTFAQQSFDLTATAHITAGIRGVIAYLQEWGGSGPGITRIKVSDFRKDLMQLAKTPRKAIRPASTSPTTTPSEGTGTLYPDSSRRRWDHFIPKNSNPPD